MFPAERVLTAPLPLPVNVEKATYQNQMASSIDGTMLEGDYINANWVGGEIRGSQRAYISAQVTEIQKILTGLNESIDHTVSVISYEGTPTSCHD